MTNPLIADPLEAQSKRDFIYTNRLGYRGQTFPKQTTQSALAMVSGTIYFTAIPLLAGDTVTNIACAINGGGGGTTVTLQKMGVYQYSGAGAVWTQRGVTADWSGSILTGTENIKPLTTAYTATVDDLYMFAAISVAATGTSVLRGHSGLSLTSPLSPNSGYAIAGSLSGQTDLVVSPSITFSGGSSVWMAWN